MEFSFISITEPSGRFLLDFWPKILNNSASDNDLSDNIIR
jgi:hypothetical protein